MVISVKTSTPDSLVGSCLAQCAGLKEVASFLDSLGLTGHVFGGAVRDALYFKACGHDIDILVSPAKFKNEEFASKVAEFARKLGAEAAVYMGSHICLSHKSWKEIIDVHFPKESMMKGLMRSDFTVNGIAFDLSKGKLEDPLGGIKDLNEKRLRIHSPQYVITNPPNFPRMFRTAAKLGFPIAPDLQTNLKKLSPMIGLHDERANVRTFLELLKFLSLPVLGGYIDLFFSCGFFDALLPELTVLHFVRNSGGNSLFERNVRIAKGFDKDLSPVGDDALNKDLGHQVNLRGCLRFSSLFIDLGSAYASLNPSAPYQRETSGTDPNGFAKRLERNMFINLGLRYKHFPGIANFLNITKGLIELCSAFGSAANAEEREKLRAACGEARWVEFQLFLRHRDKTLAGSTDKPWTSSV